MENQPQKIYALAIVAHPDDETFMLSGTSLKFADEGKSMAVVCATRGEKGTDRLGRNLTPEEIAKERAQELENAAKIIKIQKIDFLNYPDGELDEANFDELAQKLVAKINEYQPELILTFGHEGISGHRDHIAISKAAIEAAKQSKIPKEIWLGSVPASHIESFNEHLAGRKVHHSHFKEQTLKGVPDDQLMKIDIAQYADLKRQAIEQHKSQYMPGFVLDIFQKHEYYEVIKLP